jgi:hypothetical protein
VNVPGIEEWTNFNVAVAGAAAALVGLLIVAISVGVSEILATRTLPSRALATITSLGVVLVTSIVRLAPGQSALTVGAVILASTAIAMIVHSVSVQRMFAQVPKRPLHESLWKATAGYVQLVPLAVGGALLMASVAASSEWIFAGVVLVFAFSIMNAWVLLIEIRR